MRVAGSRGSVVLCAVRSGQVVPGRGAGIAAVFQGIAQEDE